MPQVNIHDAKTHFSRLVDAAASGETVTIAKAGHPVAKLVRADAPASPTRTGFLAGHGQVPDDFNTMGGSDIADIFEGA
ncbi:type II toxin-antitoxin system Phd/YefM family antitoxin [Microbacterium sp.]|uniref:type II toxin-antitoxin system Phd/YefM family antitoxin n=1 Tax=Microbacterium sp. TaxID=51671 RepID=UPI003A92DDA4